MNSFEEQLLRLKQSVKVSDDQDIAALLGMSKAAFSGRKTRESFPTKEVFALATKQPDLGLDPDWIVTGSSNKMEAANSREASLLQYFQKLNNKDQIRLLNMAQLWSGEMVLALPTRAGSDV